MIDLAEIKNYVLDATGRDITNYDDEMMKRKELVNLLKALGFNMNPNTAYLRRFNTHYSYFMFVDNYWQCSDRSLHTRHLVVPLDEFLTILGKTSSETQSITKGKTTVELISEYFKSRATT